MDPERVPCVLVGGPHDGAEYLIRAETWRSSIRTTDVTDSFGGPVPAINEYRVRLCYCGQGHPARSGSGRIIFDYVGSIY